MSRLYVPDNPGEPVHVDIKKLEKVPDGGGWRMLGRGKAGARGRVGHEYVHSVVDNHSRLAYCEVLDSENGQACARFMARAARAFVELGYRIDRVMTDNARESSRCGSSRRPESGHEHPREVREAGSEWAVDDTIHI